MEAASTAAMASESESGANKDGELKRTLGLGTLTLNGLGIILGAGIYSVIGAAAGLAGNALWLSFVLSGVVAALSALSYAELTTTYPSAGAEYVYVERAFPKRKWAAFAVGVLVVLTASATAGTVAIAFGGYLREFVELPAFLPAVALLVLCGVVNVVGVRQAAWTTVLFTLVEVAGLLLVIGVGLRTPELGRVLEITPTMGLFAAVSLVFFSFLGFENIANLAEEAKEPAKHLPKAILLSLGIATLLYALVAVAVVALLPSDELAASGAPLADAVATRSSRIAGALGGIALFATANTALASILVGSRVVYRMAKSKELPAPLASTWKARKTPWAATVAMTVFALCLVPLGKAEVVASLSSFAALIAFTATNVALIVLRKREPDRERPFRVPGSVRGVPVLPVLGALLSMALVVRLSPHAVGLGVGIVALAVLGRTLLRRSTRSHGGATASVGGRLPASE